MTDPNRCREVRIVEAATGAVLRTVLTADPATVLTRLRYLPPGVAVRVIDASDGTIYDDGVIPA